MLCSHGCRTPLFWSETGKRRVFVPNILEEVKRQVCMMRENLWIVQSRQKSYVDHRQRESTFEVGDYVYPKVSPRRGLRCFKVRGRLAPKCISPFKITKEREEELKEEFLKFLIDRNSFLDYSRLTILFR
jgi:hypothetical protein